MFRFEGFDMMGEVKSVDLRNLDFLNLVKNQLTGK